MFADTPGTRRDEVQTHDETKHAIEQNTNAAEQDHNEMPVDATSHKDDPDEEYGADVAVENTTSSSKKDENNEGDDLNAEKVKQTGDRGGGCFALV